MSSNEETDLTEFLLRYRHRESIYQVIAYKNVGSTSTGPHGNKNDTARDSHKFSDTLLTFLENRKQFVCFFKSH